MKLKSGYDQNLRVIGQALESRQITACEITSDGDRFLVRGKPEKTSTVQAFLRKWQARGAGHSGATRLSYSLLDLERLEHEGQSKRRHPDKLPDFYSLSSILRTVGRYLDLKNARLLEVYKRPLTVLILYETKEGHPNMEERTIVSFYNLFLQLYEKRQKGDSMTKPGYRGGRHEPDV